MYKLRNLAITTLLASASVAMAQVVPDPVQFTVAPETPGPSELVVIEAQGVGTFLGNATITWQEDGVVVKRGAGESQYSFTTGPVGSQTHVRVTISSETAGTIVRDFYFIPSSINLLWEADTSVPPLYRGKALYSAGSQLKVVAYPVVVLNGSRVAASQLSYIWSRNGDVAPAQSGAGRSTFTFNGDQLQTGEQVGVDAYYGNTRVGHGEIVIPAVDPYILFYARDPLLGTVYEQAFAPTISLLVQEITVVAQPYYFANSSLHSGTAPFIWTLNGQETTGPEASGGAITLRQTGGGGGVAVLELAIQNNDDDKLVQSAQTSVQILFGEQSGNLLQNLFGL